MTTSIFEKRYIYYGFLECNGKSIGNCRCELITNEVDPDSWKATISAFEGSIVDITIVMNNNTDFVFKSESDNEIISIRGLFPSMFWGSFNDEVLKFKVKDYYYHSKYQKGFPQKIELTYYIPDVEIYKNDRGLINHYKKGLLRGWNGWKNEFFDQPDVDQKEWVDEKYSVPNTLGDISFSPILLFSEQEIDGKAATIVVKQMAIECTVINPQKSINEIKSDIDRIIGDYLHILSIIERAKIDWFFCSVNTRSIEKKSIDDIQYYQQCVKRKKARYNAHFQIDRLELHKCHIDLTTLFSQKSVEDKQRIISIIDRYLVANRVSAIDTQLIYWHSCLDVLIKEFSAHGKSFNHKVVNACKKANIDWLDLYPQMNEEGLNHKLEFPINRIRNEMLHHGDYPEDYSEVFKEIPKTRALCERFITKLIGLDYKNSGLGEVDRT